MRRLWTVIALAATLALTAVMWALPASAHDFVDGDVTCETVSADFSGFPEGTHQVDFQLTPGGSFSGSFQGPAGTASASLGDALEGHTGDVTVAVSWTADGGGNANFKGEVDCPEPPPPPTSPPPPPEQPPATPPPPEQPASTPARVVVSQPILTG